MQSFVTVYVKNHYDVIDTANSLVEAKRNKGTPLSLVGKMGDLNNYCACPFSESHSPPPPLPPPPGNDHSPSYLHLSLSVVCSSRTEGYIRIRGGRSANTGRVEVCHAGGWGTICDDFWTSTQARLACSNAGLPSSS